MSESGYYPPGAEYDPRAPYNQPIPEEEPMQVTVSITLSKTFTVNLPNPGHYEKDDEGDTVWVSEREETTVDDITNRVYLPNEILEMVANGTNIETFARSCSKDWVVDDIAVFDE